MGDQRDDEPDVTTEIVYAESDDGGDSSHYAVWLRAVLAASKDRNKALENRIDLACSVLFDTDDNRDGTDDDRDGDADSWKRSYDGPKESVSDRVRDIKENVMIAAGNFLLRAFAVEYDPPPMAGYDPPAYFAVGRSDDTDDDVVCD